MISLEMIELLTIAHSPTATNEQRKQAQSKILEYRAQQPFAFLKDSAAVFVGNVSVELKQGAYALLRRSITQKTGDGKRVLWQLLSQDDNLFIKNQLLNSLVTPTRRVKRNAADLIATICNIELPKGRWPGIINVLASSTKHQNQDICLSAIMTLGSLCQLMKDAGPNCGITNQQMESILTGILVGLHSTVAEIWDTSIKALCDSMEFVRVLMGNPQIRQFTFTQLMNVREPTQDQISSILKTLAEFVRVSYPYLLEHLEQIFNITMPLIKNANNSELCGLAMAVWDTLATQYNELKVEQNTENYLDKSEALLHLTDALLNNLCVASEDDQDFQNSLRGAAYRTLYSVGMMCADQIFNRVLEFVAVNIGHQNWKHRQGSLRAFCTLLEGAETIKMKSAIIKGLVEFIRLLDDTNEDVQFGASFCLNKIGEIFPDCFFQHPQFADILKKITSKLNSTPQVSIELCNIFTELAEYARDQSSQVMEESMQSLLSALVVNAFRTDLKEKDMSLADRSFVAAMALINNTRNWQFCMKYIPMIISEFPKTFTLQKEKRSVIQTGLLTLVHSCLLTLEGQKRMNVSDDVLSGVYNTIVNLFKTINDVTSDGIYLVGSLSSFKKVPVYIESVWPYVTHALQKFNDKSMFKAALGALVDLARNNPTVFGQSPYINIVADLLKSLKISEINKELKLSIFSCIGDIIIFVRGSSLLVGYMKELMDTLVMGYQGSLHMTQSDPEYSESLRQMMVDTTTCVVHTLEHNDCSDELFRSYIKYLFEFVTLSIQLPQKKLTMEFVETSLMMLTDVLNYYYKDADTVYEIARAPVLNVCLNILERNNKRGKYTHSINFVKQVILQILQSK